MRNLKDDVLAILKDDARTPVKEIAEMLGKDEAEIASVVEQLEKTGVIVKYTAVVNDERTARDYVEALIEVKVAPVREKGFDEIAEYIYQFDEVKSVYLMSGAYDLAVFVEGRTLRDAARFVSEKLSPRILYLKSISWTELFWISRTETGLSFSHELLG